MPTTESLHETLRLAQRLGFFGRGAIDVAIAHAEHFTAAVPAETRVLYDLGSGGGLPGLVIAAARRDIAVFLVERRQTPADFLRRAIGRLGIGDRVEVLTADVGTLTRDPRVAGSADVVTARGFAHPEILAPLASALVRPGGLIVVSDPPGAAGHRRWLELPLGSWSLEFDRSDAVVSVLRRMSDDVT
jgi:16S rRNA (guanine527-N7)-methyltransferase